MRTGHRLIAIARGAALALAVLFAAAFVWVALSRVAYPFDLEWMEGAELTHSRELLAGRAIYRAPSADFIAFGYQPLYPAVVACLGRVFGLNPWTGRVVSIASTLVLASLVARVTVRETKSAFFGAMGAGLCLASYPVTGFWFDLVRVDSLFLALLFGALCVAHESSSRYGWLLTALLLFAAYKAKQLALPFFVVPLPGLVRQSKSRAILFAVASVAFIVADRVVGDALTGGWYSFFVAKIPTGQPYDWRRITVGFWVRAMAQMPVVMVAATLDCARAVRRRPPLGALGDTWRLAAFVGIAVTLAAWARPGGASNNFLTTYLFAIPPALRELHRRSTIDSSARALPFALLAAQFLALAYDPREIVPTSAQVSAGRAFIARLERVPGPVLVPEHPWYAVLAGKEPSYHSNALWELRRTIGEDRWPADLRARIATGQYAAIFTAFSVEDPDLGSYPPELAASYRIVDRMAPDAAPAGAFSGKRGTSPRFAYLYGGAPPP